MKKFLSRLPTLVGFAFVAGVLIACLWDKAIVPLAEAAYPTTVTVAATGSAAAVSTGGVYYPAPQWGNWKSMTLTNVPMANALVLVQNGWYIVGSPVTNGGLATLSGNGTTRQFTIAHLLGASPSSAWISPSSSSVSGISYVVAFDSTSIYYTIASAVSGSFSVYWGAIQ